MVTFLYYLLILITYSKYLKRNLMEMKAVRRKERASKRIKEWDSHRHTSLRDRLKYSFDKVMSKGVAAKMNVVYSATTGFFRNHPFFSFQYICFRGKMLVTNKGGI